MRVTFKMWGNWRDWLNFCTKREGEHTTKPLCWGWMMEWDLCRNKNQIHKNRAINPSKELSSFCFMWKYFFKKKHKNHSSVFLAKRILPPFCPSSELHLSSNPPFSVLFLSSFCDSLCSPLLLQRVFAPFLQSLKNLGFYLMIFERENEFFRGLQSTGQIWNSYYSFSCFVSRAGALQLLNNSTEPLF